MKNLFFILLFSSPLMASTIIPFERDVTRIERYAFMTSNNDESLEFNTDMVGDENENLFYHGFSFQNTGPNEVVPTTPEGIDYANRNFSFISEDKSKRDTYLWLTDYNGSGRVSDYFESIIVFLPRENQPHIEETSDELLVTLNTGEEVHYSKKLKTIVSGVLKEKPVDYNPDRNLRQFAGLTYHGKGIMIRTNARGADPRIGTTAQILKEGLAPCEIPSKVLWTQDGYPKFRFVSDEEVYQIIKDNCGAEFVP